MTDPHFATDNFDLALTKVGEGVLWIIPGRIRAYSALKA